jgi:hypothetical protein
MQELVNNE